MLHNGLLYAAIALGGGLGACSRYAISAWVNKQISSGFPFATLLVNIIGGVFIGVLFVVLQQKSFFPEISKPLLITGFLGGLTTFSTFSLESVQLINTGQYIQALVYMVTSVVLCVLACFIALALSKIVIGS